eukprot:scaffold12116_cov125-Cylindrotheca_fusiformis.AAC.5
MQPLPSLTPLMTMDRSESSTLQDHFFTEQAHWVVPGLILAGQSPAQAKDDVEGYIQDLTARAKITTYVCLQSEVQPQPNDTQDGYEVLEEALPTTYGHVATKVNPAAKFVYYGMKDDEIAPSDESLQTLIANLTTRVQTRGEILYIHCKGGSGRTGIVTACLLGALYPKLAADDVLKRIQLYFEMRWRGVGKPVDSKRKSPATEEQKDQVRRLLLQRDKT